MKKTIYVAFHKPYGVNSQFSGEDATKTLAQFNLPREIYAAGRLDQDSEGLLLLTNDGPLIKRLLDPKNEKEKIYWVQVENVPTPEALEKMSKGLTIQDYQTLPCQVKILDPQPVIPERDPPIRKRLSIPTCWIEVKLKEGKNRQVRKMTAAIGYPTLRLIRVQIGKLKLSDLSPGQWREIKKEEII